MAGIDYSIPGQFKGLQLESPMNAMAQAMQLRNLQETSQMNALRAQEYELKTREAKETSRQRNALAQYLADPKKPTDALQLEAGVRKVAPLLADQWVDSQLKRGELEEKISERGFRNFDRKFKLYQSFVPGVNSVDGVSQFVSAAYKDPDLAPILTQIRPFEEALNANLDEYNRDPENWKLNAAGVSPDKIMEIARNKAKEEREANKPVVVSPGGVLVSPSGDEIFKAPDREKESDLARLQRERADIFNKNKDDPRLKQYDAAIAKATTTNQPLSDLARKQNELADLEEQLLKTPNDKKLRERIDQYRKDIKKDTEFKPPVVNKYMQGPKPSDTTLDFLAQQYIQDSSTISAVPKGLRMAVINRAVELTGRSAKDMASDVIANRQDTAATKAAVKDFTSGKSAVATRSFNTAIDHLETMEKLATALQNGDMRVFNSVGNFFAKQTGTAAPANFEAAKAIVGGEVAKALTGANMALKDREEIRDAIIASSSPEQLRGVLKTFKQLLGGQLNSLNIQYQTGTGRDDFRNKLSPASRRELDALNPQAPGANAPRQMSTQDQEALKWANANANDPRAVAIKKRLGVK